MRSIADHGEIVGDAEEFIEPVGDVDDCGALSPELVDLGEEDFDFLGGDGGRRLVHDHDVGLLGNRLHDLEHLNVGDRQVLELGLRIVFEAFAAQQSLRALADLRPIDPTHAVDGLDAKEQRFFDCDFWDVVQLL
jgi:hypothetical protein